MRVTIEWQPNDGPPETLTWNDATHQQYESLCANYAHSGPDDALWIPINFRPGMAAEPRLFRVGRITDIRAEG